LSYTFPQQFRRIYRRRPMASSQDAWYLSLLGLAENFRTSNRIKMCIQCLQAVFSFKPPPRVEARTHLQLGNILLQYTKNTDLARTHLEQAVISLPIGHRPPSPPHGPTTYLIRFLPVLSGCCRSPSTRSTTSNLRQPVSWPSSTSNRTNRI
jgi:hypothetical protein